MKVSNIAVDETNQEFNNKITLVFCIEDVCFLKEISINHALYKKEYKHWKKFVFYNFDIEIILFFYVFSIFIIIKCLRTKFINPLSAAIYTDLFFNGIIFFMNMMSLKYF